MGISNSREMQRRYSRARGRLHPLPRGQPPTATGQHLPSLGPDKGPPLRCNLPLWRGAYPTLHQSYRYTGDVQSSYNSLSTRPYRRQSVKELSHFVWSGKERQAWAGSRVPTEDGPRIWPARHCTSILLHQASSYDLSFSYVVLKRHFMISSIFRRLLMKFMSMWPLTQHWLQTSMFECITL